MTGEGLGLTGRCGCCGDCFGCVGLVGVERFIGAEEAPLKSPPLLVLAKAEKGAGLVLTAPALPLNTLTSGVLGADTLGNLFREPLLVKGGLDTSFDLRFSWLFDRSLLLSGIGVVL